MSRDEMIEAMKRALDPLDEIATTDGFCDWAEVATAREECLMRMRDVLDAIPGLADVLDGKAVIVPVDATGTMLKAVRDSDMLNGLESASVAIIAWSLMLAASPYRRQ
jgi:hypothetical protein